jgi:hypothetical protein
LGSVGKVLAIAILWETKMDQVTSRRKFSLMALGLATGGLAIAAIAAPAMAFKVNVPGGEGNEGPEHEGAEGSKGSEHKGRHRRRKHKKN